jgi:hypothetical protein
MRAGEFEYEGVSNDDRFRNGFVDDDDLTLLGAFFDPAAAPLISPAPLVSGGGVSGEGLSAVPEPATVVLAAMAVAAVALLGARRGRRGQQACRRWLREEIGM